VQHPVVGQPDDAHAAAAEFAGELVAPADDPLRCPPVVMIARPGPPVTSAYAIGPCAGDRAAHRYRGCMSSTDPRGAEDELHRPGVLRWLWYALGGALPARHRTWVLHDTTTGTWGVRHVLRAAVQMALPVAVVLVVVPGPFWIRGMTALGGLMLGLIFSLAYMSETTENRVKKAGYPAGTAQAVRDVAQRSRSADRTARLQADAAKRAARYRERQGR